MVISESSPSRRFCSEWHTAGIVMVLGYTESLRVCYHLPLFKLPCLGKQCYTCTSIAHLQATVHWLILLVISNMAAFAIMLYQVLLYVLVYIYIYMFFFFNVGSCSNKPIHIYCCFLYEYIYIHSYIVLHIYMHRQSHTYIPSNLIVLYILYSHELVCFLPPVIHSWYR